MKFNLRQLFFIVLILAIFLMTLRPIADPDFWWHLRSGEILLQSRSILHQDIFSFTKAGAPWIMHEWLSELILYGLFWLGGYALLILTFSFIITAAFFLTYLCSPRESRPYIAGFVLLLGAISTAPTWGVRPQMISLLLTSLFLWLLTKYHREDKNKYIIPLPFITLVWVNLHAGYFLGLVMIAIFITGDLIEILLTELKNQIQANQRPRLRQPIALSAALGLCILATLANPNGYHIILYPFTTLTSPSMQQFIQEWLSPDFHNAIWQPLALLILVLIGIGMVSKKRISAAYIILALAFGYLALHSMRNVPLFAVVSIPILSEQISDLVVIKKETNTPSLIVKIGAPVLLVLALALTCYHFIQVVQEQPQVEAEYFPKGAVDWLLERKPNGNLFNAYAWGGYLIWKAYPQYSVYVDGRADVYGDAFLFDYMSIYHAEPGWEDKLNKAKVNIILIESDSPIANVLRGTPGWQIVYQDKISIIFTRGSE